MKKRALELIDERCCVLPKITVVNIKNTAIIIALTVVATVVSKDEIPIFPNIATKDADIAENKA